VLLELPADPTLEDAQAAFHKIARFAHPDLHRTSLTPDDLEVVTAAYAQIAAAYADVRSKLLATQRIRAIGDGPTQPMRTTHDTAPNAAAGAMSGKALVYYRRAELCLRRGELKGAVLQLKLAIATDPHSAFLRAALAEVEPEVAKKP
jgi:hypothetical protein